MKKLSIIIILFLLPACGIGRSVKRTFDKVADAQQKSFERGIWEQVIDVSRESFGNPEVSLMCGWDFKNFKQPKSVALPFDELQAAFQYQTGGSYGDALVEGFYNHGDQTVYYRKNHSAVLFHEYVHSMIDQNVFLTLKLYDQFVMCLNELAARYGSLVYKDREHLKLQKYLQKSRERRRLRQ